MKRIYACIAIVAVLLGVAFYSSWKVQSFAEVISADLDAAAEAIRNADHPAARQALADGAARCDQMRTSMNHLLRTADFTELEAALRAADRNPYSWNMEYYEYPDGSGYEARFDKCGICALMKEQGLYDLTPAMCHLDYTMAEAGGTANFVREYTLASGGPYCDCGYKKKA